MTLDRFSQTADVTVADTVVETSIIGSGIGGVGLNADELSPGKTIKILAAGYFSDTGTPTMDVRIKLGSTTIVDSGAVALTGAQSNAGWEIEATIVCRTDGASGTVIAQGEFRYEGETIGLVSTSTTAIDTTSAQALDVTVEWGTADPANTLTCAIFLVEVAK